MASSAARFVRLIAPLTMAAALAAAASPALVQAAVTSGACESLNFQLSNPSPGSRVQTGSSVISGWAMDTRAPAGSAGIDRIDFFLGDRDSGGTFIGTTAPGTATDFITPAPFGTGSFQATVAFPDDPVGGQNLFAYAHDTVSGLTGIIWMPISIGQDPEAAFENPPTTMTQLCLAPGGGSTTTTTTTAPPVTSPATGPMTVTTTTTTLAPASARTIALNVSNPSPGNSILVGSFAMEGTAFDKAASSGSGIDRVDIFLGNRDEGGMGLGQATLLDNNAWRATVDIPTNAIGLQSIWVYAHSALSNQSAVVSIPVTTMR